MLSCYIELFTTKMLRFTSRICVQCVSEKARGFLRSVDHTVRNVGCCVYRLAK